MLLRRPNCAATGSYSVCILHPCFQRKAARMTDTFKLLAAGLAMLVLILLVWAIGFVLEEAVLLPIADAIGWDWVRSIPLTLIFVCGLFAFSGRRLALPISHRIEATTEIDAPVSDVWDMIVPRTRDDYWTATITHTVRDRVDPSLIDYHFEGTEAIGAPSVLHCQITGEEPHRYFAYRALNGDAFPLFAGDVVLSEYKLQDLGDTTRVTLTEHLDRLQFVTIPLLLWMNPNRDSLLRMKAIAEGVPDTSWSGRTAQKLRESEAEQTISTYSFFKWCALAMIPLAFTLAMISFIGSATAP